MLKRKKNKQDESVTHSATTSVKDEEKETKDESVKTETMSKKEKRKIEKEEQKKKKKKKKKLSPLRYLKFSNIATEIHGYGYDYSFSKYLLTMMGTFLFIVAAGKFFNLELQYIVLLGLIYLFIFPIILLDQFRYMYEQKRFRDVVEYAEQMIYSFKKKSKILVALKDASTICEGKMLKLVEEAIAFIENNHDSQNIYADALAIIEKEYHCDRLSILHDFLVKVELGGGAYQNTLNVILDDIKAWTERTYLFQKDRGDMKKKIIMSLGMSLIICGTTVVLLTKDPTLIKATQSSIYQILTFATLTIFLILFMVTQKLLTGSWLKVTVDENEKYFDQQWERIRHFDKKKERKKSIIMAILTSSITIYGLMLRDVKLIAMGIGITVLALYIPTKKYKGAKKKLSKEIEKKFPMWLRGIALGLQTDNVYVSILNSIETAPYVLQEELRIFVDRIEKDPISIMPYQQFLEGFELPEIKSTIKMLYSLSSYGSDDAEGQINSLIVRNNALLDKSERVENEDSVAVVGILTYVPMLLGTLKMLCDLMLLMGVLFKFAG